MRLSGDAGTAFDRLARIAAQTLGARTALVTVIDNDRQRYRAVHGGSFAECSTADSFCAQLADRGPGAVLIVPDAASDPFFGLKPAVIDGFVGFYAGAAITRTDGGLTVQCASSTVTRVRRRPTINSVCCASSRL